MARSASQNSALPESAWHSTRYRIEREIARGGMGVVYRAFDRLAQRTVALKQIVRDDDAAAAGAVSASAAPVSASKRLSLSATIPSLNTTTLSDDKHRRLALAREFRILAALRHPNIISVLDYGFDQLGRSYLVMELLDGACSLTEACRTLAPEQRIRLLAKLMQALRYLHYAGVVHRDVKPDNVLVAQADTDPIVKVVDFGLAIDVVQPTSQTIAAGTLAYMAPEVLAGAPPSKASDMYALGVLCYQVCAERHPFAPPSATEQGVPVRNAPDLEALALNDDGRALIGSLLLANPALRLQDAGEALDRWCKANDLPIPQEPVASRTSFLRASRFVGREAELRKLTDALDAALRERGSTWIVSGSSGVGKSRLLDEVKTVAQVRGMLVLRGQARDSGGRSFALWRDVLRELALTLSLTALEASVLKSLISDLDRLLERPIEPAAQLTRDGNLQRLAGTVQRLFERLPRPTLLLLEDLQWASAASVAVLRRVLSGVAGRPVVVLGSVRTEQRPAWLSELSGSFEMRLYPFADDLVKAMCETVLGSSGAQPAVAAPVSQASQGNALLVVEMLRSLVEQRSGGEGVTPALAESHAELTPEALLQRRIARVPAWARPPLELAAVAGREIDLQLLGEVVIDLHGWLQTCAATGILEVNEARWCFSHDKLREQLLAQLDDDTRRQRHVEVAEALRGAFGEQVPAHLMAYHCDAAGEIAAALPYTLAAAEKALEQGALQKAQQLADRALRYGDHVTLSLHDKVRARRVLIDTGFGLAEPHRSVAHTRAMLDEVGLRWPDRDRPPAVLSQLLDTLRTAPLPPLPRAHDEAIWALVMAAAWTSFRVHIFLNDAPQAFLLILLIHQLSRALGLPERTAEAHCGIAYALSMTPLRAAGLRLLESAGRVIEQHGDDRGRNTLLEGRAMVMINLGRWRQAVDTLQALELHGRKLGDERVQWFAKLQQSLTLQARGHIDQSQQKVDEVDRYARVLADRRLQGMTRIRRGWLALHKGDCEAAAKLFEGVASDRLITNVRLGLMGGLCTALWHGGHAREGEEQARAMLELLGGPRTGRLGGHAGLFSVPAMAHVLLSAYQRHPDAERRRHAEDALTQLTQYGRQFVIGQPSALRLRGRHAQLCGQSRRARRLLRQSADAARRLGMWLDHAMAIIELAAAQPDRTKRSRFDRAEQRLRSQADRAEQSLRSRNAEGCIWLAGGAALR